MRLPCRRTAAGRFPVCWYDSEHPRVWQSCPAQIRRGCPFNIVDARRIVFTYDIRLDARRMSVSLVTVEFFASRRGARMVYTEQLAYLDGMRTVPSGCAERKKAWTGSD